MTRLFIGMSAMSWIPTSYADHAALNVFEKSVIQKYKDADFYEVNADIASDISKQISSDVTSYSYDFPYLQKAGYVQIHYSPDKKLKFYTFDVSGGGTMGEWYTDVQYTIGDKTLVDEFKAGYISKVSQSNIKNKPVYLVQNYYKGDSCHGAYDVRAVEIGAQQLLKAYVFEGKNKTNHEITVEFDCHKVPDRSEALDYIRVTPKTVDIMLLNTDLVPQNKYLRYRLEKNAYKYIGIVK